MTHPHRDHPLPPEYPGISEPSLPADGMSPFECAVNLVVAAVLVALGLYGLFGPI